MAISATQIDGGQTLPIAEHFYTIQGEGRNAGRAAYFIRLAGCDVGCTFCDAKYAMAAREEQLMSIKELIAKITATSARLAIITGGEPLLYPLAPLTDALHAVGLKVGIETSGTHPLSGSFDWICLSPKPQKPPTTEALLRADELKVVVCRKEDIQWAEQCATRVKEGCRLYLQPEWSVVNEATELVVEWVKAHPKWQISIQSHKYINIP